MVLHGEYLRSMLILTRVVIIIIICVSYLLQMVPRFAKLRLSLPIIVLCSLALIFLLKRPRMIIPDPYSDDKDLSDYKYILTWTPDTPNVKLMGWSYPELDGFQHAGCAEYRCHLTNNRSYLGQTKGSFNFPQ